MDFINFSKAKCNDCYKCIRICSTKAISVLGDREEIDQDRCISCGECYVICENEALSIKDKVEEVKKALACNKKVVVSLAPSFPGAFSFDQGEQMVAALKKLGVHAVEETAIGAELVISTYEEYAETSELNNLISTCCPSANYLIEKYYPELKQYMIPIASPMVVHGKMLRKKYGPEVYVVFIGPCIAKKVEATRYEGVIDSVLTFVELKQWFEGQQIELKQMPLVPFDARANFKGQEISCGILLSKEKSKRYEKLVVSGVDRCMEILESLRKGDINGIFLEILSCPGGCIDGTGMPKDSINYYVRGKHVKDYIKTYQSAGEPIILNDRIPLSPDELVKSLPEQRVYQDKISQLEINEVLVQMGKEKKEDILNCNACGYGTCKELAESILRGTSHVNMCLPFMRGKAESLKNVIFDKSPNAIFMLGFDLTVKEFNPSSEKIFQTQARDIKDKRIGTIIPEEEFKKVLETKVSLIGKRVEYSNYKVILVANIIYLEKEGILLVIMFDITTDEKNKEELIRVKENTLNIAQAVIDKQMRVAQEIAGLLGETTAETKVALTKLKNIVIVGRGDD
jgi:iron only hydrogenase large subunit-like protein/uncharacterized Fe-S cluster-containing protein